MRYMYKGERCTAVEARHCQQCTEANVARTCAASQGLLPDTACGACMIDPELLAITPMAGCVDLQLW